MYLSLCLLSFFTNGLSLRNGAVPDVTKNKLGTRHLGMLIYVLRRDDTQDFTETFGVFTTAEVLSTEIFLADFPSLFRSRLASPQCTLAYSHIVDVWGGNKRVALFCPLRPTSCYRKCARDVLEGAVCSAARKSRNVRLKGGVLAHPPHIVKTN